MTRRLLHLVTLLAVALAAAIAAPQRAHAQGEPANVVQARQLYQQGISAFDKGEYAEAEKLLRQSYKLHPHPATLNNLAVALEKQERKAEAANEYTRLLRTHREPPEERTKAEAALARLEPELGKLEVEVSVTGADVKIDGKWAGISPLPKPWYVAAGEHTVSAGKSGFTEASETVTAEAGQSAPVALTPTAVSAEMPGVGLGTAEPKANGGDGELRPKTMAIIAGAVLTAVGLGVGIGFAVDKSAAEDDASALREQAIGEVGAGGCANSSAAVCADLADANDRVARSGTISTIGFVGAGVAAAATVAAYFLWSDGESKARTGGVARRSWMVGPAVSDRAGGVSIIGQF